MFTTLRFLKPHRTLASATPASSALASARASLLRFDCPLFFFSLPSLGSDLDTMSRLFKAVSSFGEALFSRRTSLPASKAGVHSFGDKPVARPLKSALRHTPAPRPTGLMARIRSFFQTSPPTPAVPTHPRPVKHVRFLGGQVRRVPYWIDREEHVWPDQVGLRSFLDEEYQREQRILELRSVLYMVFKFCAVFSASLWFISFVSSL